MTELTEREQQIVAWLRKEAGDWSQMGEGLVASALSGAANAIERGEPWGEQA